MTTFRVWAPQATEVHLHLEDGRTQALDREADGYFAGAAPAPPGARYRFQIDDRPQLLADPASRFQPDGPFGPSEVVDPTTFEWTDHAWKGLTKAGLVIYELHVGTFTSGGTWRSAARELPALAALGVNCIEVMPIAEFAGTFGWGYDGVFLFAPMHTYGRPDDFRHFVDEAHRLGVGVILDVVYNHLGPAGADLTDFSDSYFGAENNDWGRNFNFDGPNSAPVREFVCANAEYWVRDFHLDGLRLDATQSIPDASPRHIIAEIVARARAAAGAKPIVIVAENEPQHAKLARPVEDGGYGVDLLWNDDWHHSARVAATGWRDGYYRDYEGRARELAAATRGFLYQGQWYTWQKQRRGTTTGGMTPNSFVAFLDNHDQVANTPDGGRIHTRTTPSRHRALTALLLLGPWTPMLFQGQEFSASSPFNYFADHTEPLCAAVQAGRREFMSQFATLTADQLDALATPHDIETLRRSTVDHAERARHLEAAALHADLIGMRTSHRAIANAGVTGVDSVALSDSVLVMRFRLVDPLDDRLLIVSIGASLTVDVLSDPVFATDAEGQWLRIWSSDDPRYGGPGGGPSIALPPFTVPADCALLFAPSGARRDQ